jgi:hypothetical protein
MTTKIYVLCEPDGEIRYIGKTVKPLSARLASHISEARRGFVFISHRLNWLRSVLSTGFLPVIQLIGEADGDGYSDEQAWIAYGRSEGWRLVNDTDGGKGVLGRKHSAESIKKMSAARKGKALSLEHRLKIGIGVKDSPAHKRYFDGLRLQGGRQVSPATRLTMRAAWKNSPASQKHLEALNERRRIEGVSIETRRKIGEGNKGKYVSVDTRKKRSISILNSPAYKVHVDKIRKQGISSETRRKLIEAHQRRRAR